MTRIEKLVVHGAELQKDLNDLRTAYADLAKERQSLAETATVYERTIVDAEKETVYYKNLAHKLSEKLDMMETAVCNLVSMMFRK